LVFATVRLRTPRFAAAFGVLTGAVVLVAPLSVRGALFPDTAAAHAMVFYLVTAGAYAVLPFVRRGDIAMVAMWLVLAVGIAPCFAGQELSAEHKFAYMGGVLMAAAPIYIARFRQLAQGDTRLFRRRETETAG